MVAGGNDTTIEGKAAREREREREGGEGGGIMLGGEGCRGEMAELKI